MLHSCGVGAMHVLTNLKWAFLNFQRLSYMYTLMYSTLYGEVVFEDGSCQGILKKDTIKLVKCVHLHLLGQLISAKKCHNENQRLIKYLQLALVALEI